MNSLCKHSLLFLLGLCSISFALISCKSAPTPTEPVSPSFDTTQPTGIIKGNVRLYYDYSPGRGIDSVRVGIDSLPYYSTYTDSSGKFELKAPTGAHVLRFTKPGYGEQKIYGVTFFAPDTITVPELFMTKKPSTHLTTFYAQGVFHDTILRYYFVIPIDSGSVLPNTQGMILKFYRTAANNEEPVYQDYIMGTPSLKEVGAPYVMQSLQSNRLFSRGDTLYIRLQLANLYAYRGPIGYYTDPFTKLTYNTAVTNLSESVRVILGR